MKKFLRFFLFLTGVLALYGLCKAQPASIFVDDISAEEGLSGSTVTDILQDQRGFLWIGTQDGLNRYNGYGFDIFRPQKNDSASIPGNHITSLFEDAEGFIWVNTLNDGMSRLGPNINEFTKIDHAIPFPADFNPDNIVDIDRDTSGNIIIADQHALFTYDPVSGNINKLIVLADSLMQLHITAFETDDAGNIWISERSRGLIRYHVDSGESKIFKPPETDGVSASFSLLYRQGNGIFWIGGKTEIYIFDADTETFKKFLITSAAGSDSPNARITCLLQDDYGHFWAGTDAGLFVLNQHSNAFEPVALIGIPQTDTPPSITSIYSDKFGVLWIGTQDNGLLKHLYSAQNFRFLLRNEIITATASAENGKFWTGTRNGTIFKVNEQGGISTRFSFISKSEESMTDREITALFRDSEGDIWVGSRGGLNLIRNNEIELVQPNVKHVEKSLKSGISAIYEDSRGIIWLGTAGDIMYGYDRKQKRFVNLGELYDVHEDMKIEKVSAMYEDLRGNFWIGTKGLGLFRVDVSSKNVNRYSMSDGFYDNTINVIAGSKKGVTWFGTDYGLTKFDFKTESFISYSTEDGLAGNVIHGILSDTEGHLWISTNAGLVEFEPITLNTRVFDKGDGFPSDEFRTGVYYRSNSGEMYFGSHRGIVIFHPDSLKINRTSPDVLITGVYILKNGRTLYSEGDNLLSGSTIRRNNIKVPHDKNSFRIEYIALHYAAPLQNQYMYMLQGKDEVWHQADNSRAVTYLNLNPGDYNFIVKAANKHGVWSQREAKLNIVIAPPFWRSPQAYVLYIIFFIGIFGLVFYLKIIRKENTESDSYILDQQLESSVQSRTRELKAEKNKSEEILYNILPHDIADEIKETGHAIPRRYEHVTVLFTDFENFTEKAATLSAKKLVDEINEIFENFDSITKANGVEKIKTIGDAYMAVCGLPTETEDHALRCVKAAKEMLRYIEKRNKTAPLTWNMRVGMHSGNVIAGVVGKNKFTYDIWGNTVIIASRMEEAGIPGTINISSSTYELIKDQFDCEYRGKIPAAKKSKIEMYLVKLV